MIISKTLAIWNILVAVYPLLRLLKRFWIEIQFPLANTVKITYVRLADKENLTAVQQLKARKAKQT